MRVLKLLILIIMVFKVSTLWAAGMNQKAIRTFFENTEYRKVANVIVAITILETGWYKSDVHNELNNPFSYKEIDKSLRDARCSHRPIYCMKKYDNIIHACKDLLEYFKRHNYPKDPEAFIWHLKKKGYAEDPRHSIKVKSIYLKLKRQQQNNDKTSFS